MRFDFIITALPNLKTEISPNDETITIFNPYSENNIVVDYEFYQSIDGLNSFERYTVRFSYQHRHFEQKSEVVEWIKSIISEKLLVIEFFNGTENRFGSEISSSTISQLTYNVFVKRYGCYVGFSQCDNFKIRSWSRENDYDGIIFTNKEKGTYIVMNKV